MHYGQRPTSPCPNLRTCPWRDPHPPLPCPVLPPRPQDLTLHASCTRAEEASPALRLAAALALTPCPALGRLQSLEIRVPSLPADTLQLVCAQLTQLQSLSVHAELEVCGPDGRPVPASELLGGLPALSTLTRLTSLTVEGRSPAGQGGPPPGNGASAQDVLLALPPGARLKEVGRFKSSGLGGGAMGVRRWAGGGHTVRWRAGKAGRSG